MYFYIWPVRNILNSCSFLCAGHPAAQWGVVVGVSGVKNNSLWAENWPGQTIPRSAYFTEILTAKTGNFTHNFLYKCQNVILKTDLYQKVIIVIRVIRSFRVNRIRPLEAFCYKKSILQLFFPIDNPPNLYQIYLKFTWALVKLSEHMHKKFGVRRTKIKGGCQSERKAAKMISYCKMLLVT